MNYKEKYLKYKRKYIDLKNQLGGAEPSKSSNILLQNKIVSGPIEEDNIVPYNSEKHRENANALVLCHGTKKSTPVSTYTGFLGKKNDIYNDANVQNHKLLINIFKNIREEHEAINYITVDIDGSVKPHIIVPNNNANMMKDLVTKINEFKIEHGIGNIKYIILMNCPSLPNPNPFSWFNIQGYLDKDREGGQNTVRGYLGYGMFDEITSKGSKIVISNWVNLYTRNNYDNFYNLEDARSKNSELTKKLINNTKQLDKKGQLDDDNIIIKDISEYDELTQYFKGLTKKYELKNVIFSKSKQFLFPHNNQSFKNQVPPFNEYAFKGELHYIGVLLEKL